MTQIERDEEKMMNLRSIKAGFVGFGEVNSPRELVEQKCLEAQHALQQRGLELVITAPVRDDPQGLEEASSQGRAVTAALRFPGGLPGRLDPVAFRYRCHQRFCPQTDGAVGVNGRLYRRSPGNDGSSGGYNRFARYDGRFRIPLQICVRSPG
jgi:hypothetical protein